MSKKILISLLAVSIIACVFVYLTPGYKLRRALTAGEWKGASVLLFSAENSLGLSEDEAPLEKVEVYTNTRYLPDGMFVKVTHLNIFRREGSAGAQPPSKVEFTESGQWELHRNYLLLKDTEISNVPTEKSLDLTHDQVSDLRERLLMTEQQSSRVEIINEHSLLLTGLNQNSQLLHAN